MSKNMKYVVFLLFFLMRMMDVCGQGSHKTYNYCFSKNDFTLYEEKGINYISPLNYPASYLSDCSLPRLPHVNICILLPSGSEVNNVSYDIISKDTIGICALGSNSLEKDNSSDVHCNTQPTIMYDRTKTYPSNNIVGWMSNTMDGYRILTLSFCPFIYESNVNRLSLIASVKFQVDFSDYKTAAFSELKKGDVMREHVENLVVNPEEIDVLYPSISKANSTSVPNYLIVTSDSLKSSFNELVKWKRMKGLNVNVVSVEDIYNNYTYPQDYTKQEKIRAILSSYYRNHNLKYVLLGGDETIVPAQMCYGEVVNLLGTIRSYEIPTDMFYACFDGDWDRNNNGIYGEIEDNIDYMPEIFLTRLPVCNSEQIKAYIDKLIEYEKDASSSFAYKDKMLFAGKELNFHVGEISDCQYWGEIISNDSIIPYYPNAEFDYLYDDSQSNVDNLVFYGPEIQEALAKGYHFVNVDTHGEFNLWKARVINYTADDASDLISPCASVILTTACHTNNFAKDSICLGEALIRNPNNGNVAYWGSSDKAWSYISKDMGMGISLQCMNNFYNYLFRNKITSFGELTTLAKTILLNDCFSYSSARWTMFSQNAMGDPEFDIHMEQNKFSNVKFYMSTDNIQVFTDDNDYDVTLRYCIEDEEPNYEYSRNTMDDCIFTGLYEGNIDIGINKKGYSPFISYVSLFDLICMQNLDYIGNQHFTAKNYNIGSNIVPTFESGGVNLKSGSSLDIDVTDTFVIMGDFCCEKGASLNVNISK